VFFVVRDGLGDLPEVVGNAWPAAIMQICTVAAIATTAAPGGAWHAAPVCRSSISAVRTERTAHLVPLGHVSARQRYLEPVSGFEPLTIRLQGGRSAC
jgi:hypothetical protein